MVDSIVYLWIEKIWGGYIKIHAPRSTPAVNKRATVGVKRNIESVDKREVASAD